MVRPRLFQTDGSSSGLSPLLEEEVFGAIRQMHRDSGSTMLLVERHAGMALSVAFSGLILGQENIVLDGEAATLAANADVEKLRRGGHCAARKSFRNLKPCKRRKRWL
jgi:branched-chain amino acid transport system ATP-binding protein